MTVVIGAGAFGTALAVALSSNGPVTLVARKADWAETRINPRLPGLVLPSAVRVTGVLPDAGYDIPVLLAVPMQALSACLQHNASWLNGRSLVACCKGIDLATLRGPTSVITAACDAGAVSILTGPSFAADIGRGLPTALTLACADVTAGERLQALLSTPTLRLYRTTDVTGAELGGALKNVIAIAAGIVMGAGLGESARAALMTRGFAEMERFALHQGARLETLAGLSGFGDLVLTCCSSQSRNFQHGFALGRGEPPDSSLTVEGLATAQALTVWAQRLGMADEMPITAMVAAVTAGRHTVRDAIQALMSRPLRQE